MFARAALGALALVVCLWLLAGLRSSHLAAEAERPSGTMVKINPADLERRRDMLDDARRLNPDPTPDIREAQLLIIADRDREAVRVVRKVVEREPENYEAWLVLRQAAFRGDSALFRRATREALRLNPLARRAGRDRQ
jgi:predicted Zn-dependent protease